jgi:threonine/homoserine/homoserine lactone efflux protein
LNGSKIGHALECGQHFDKSRFVPDKSLPSKWSQLMTLTGFLAYSAALAVAVAVPGPGVVAMVARGLGSGFRAALPFTFGIALGDLVYLTAAVLGLAFVAQTFGVVFLAVKYAGAVYLLYLAYKFWTSGAGFDRVEARRAEGPVASFLSGLMVTLGNPKVMVFYLALLPAIVDLSTVTIKDYFALVVLTSIILLAILLPYLALATRTRALLQTPKALKRISRVAAGFLGGAAVMIATRA